MLSENTRNAVWPTNVQNQPTQQPSTPAEAAAAVMQKPEVVQMEGAQTTTSTAAGAAQEDEEKRVLKGAIKTVLTSGRGLGSQAPTSGKKRLLGS
jgi:hypothetical protein